MDTAYSLEPYTSAFNPSLWDSVYAGPLLDPLEGFSQLGAYQDSRYDATLLQDDDEVLFVNPKQYHRIVKRRAARARLEELAGLSKQRKPYQHESRHKHACRRPRGKGGRFLTQAELAERQRSESGSPPAPQEESSSMEPPAVPQKQA